MKKLLFLCTIFFSINQILGVSTEKKVNPDGTYTYPNISSKRIGLTSIFDFAHPTYQNNITTEDRALYYARRLYFEAQKFCKQYENKDKKMLHEIIDGKPKHAPLLLDASKLEHVIYGQVARKLFQDVDKREPKKQMSDASTQTDDVSEHEQRKKIADASTQTVSEDQNNISSTKPIIFPSKTNSQTEDWYDEKGNRIPNCHDANEKDWGCFCEKRRAAQAREKAMATTKQEKKFKKQSNNFNRNLLITSLIGVGSIVAGILIKIKWFNHKK